MEVFLLLRAGARLNRSGSIYRSSLKCPRVKAGAVLSAGTTGAPSTARATDSDALATPDHPVGGAGLGRGRGRGGGRGPSRGVPRRRDPSHPRVCGALLGLGRDVFLPVGDVCYPIHGRSVGHPEPLRLHHHLLKLRKSLYQNKHHQQKLSRQLQNQSPNIQNQSLSSHSCSCSSDVKHKGWSFKEFKRSRDEKGCPNPFRPNLSLEPRSA